MQLILSLISGAIGGYMAGAVLENSLAPAGNVIIGLIGGGASEKILTSTGVLSGSVVEQIAGSGIGGAVLVLIVRVLTKSSHLAAPERLTRDDFRFFELNYSPARL